MKPKILLELEGTDDLTVIAFSETGIGVRPLLPGCSAICEIGGSKPIRISFGDKGDFPELPLRERAIKAWELLRGQS